MEAVIKQAGADLLGVMPDFVSQVRRVTARIFGCWHRNMSRPFSRGSETYRTCVACDARRRFDTEQWEMVGPFYYPERKSPLYARTR